LSGEQIKKSEIGGRVALTGVKRGAYRFLVGKPDGKCPLGRPRHSWEDNIRMDLEAVGKGRGLN
jgi:hypothetical protein